MLHRSLRTGTCWRCICCPSWRNWSLEINKCSTPSTSAMMRSFNILVTLFRPGEPIPVRMHPWWQNTSQNKCSMDFDPCLPQVELFTPWFVSIDLNSSTALLSSRLTFSTGFVVLTCVTGTPRRRPLLARLDASLEAARDKRSSVSTYKRERGLWSKSPQQRWKFQLSISMSYLFSKRWLQIFTQKKGENSCTALFFFLKKKIQLQSHTTLWALAWQQLCEATRPIALQAGGEGLEGFCCNLTRWKSRDHVGMTQIFTFWGGRFLISEFLRRLHLSPMVWRSERVPNARESCGSWNPEWFHNETDRSLCWAKTRPVHAELCLTLLGGCFHAWNAGIWKLQPTVTWFSLLWKCMEVHLRWSMNPRGSPCSLQA